MLITTELLLQGHQRFFFLNLLLVATSSALFLILQRRVLAGSLAGGRRIGAAVGEVPIGRQPGTARLTITSRPGWVRPPIWTRAATAGYRPYDRIRADREIGREVYQQQKYTHQWKRRQQRREAPRTRSTGNRRTRGREFG